MIRVLLVDDSLFRAGLRSRLEMERDITPVGEAGTAAQAVVKARSLQPDLVLLDVLLPCKSAFDAIPELAKVSPTSKVLVISSQTTASSARRAISAGAVGYIPKRASDGDLVAAIRRVASGERYVDPELGAQLVVADGTPALEPLSERERDVLHLLALGYMNRRSARSCSSRFARSTRTARTSCASYGSRHAQSSCCSRSRTA